jgi:hypothetical protein
MGMSHYHEDDLLEIAPFIGPWIEKHPEVEFVSAGDPRTHDILGVPKGQRVTTSKCWIRGLDLPLITSTFDVGLVPLVKNDFNEAKSCLKGMEYAACGIPCIATPTAEYRRWVKEGENGYLAEPEGFTARLDDLLVDRELLERMGQHARLQATEASLEKHIQEWETFYAGCDRRNSNSVKKRGKSGRVQALSGKPDRPGGAFDRIGLAQKGAVVHQEQVGAGVNQ